MDLLAIIFWLPAYFWFALVIAGVVSFNGFSDEPPPINQRK